MKIKDVGEFGLIDRIKSRATTSKNVIVGIGDDAAVLEFDKKQFMLCTTDSLVEDVHFMSKFSSPEQIGMKAVEQNVSDIAAMGGFPKYMMVSFGFPKNMELKKFDGIVKGIAKKARKYKIGIVGGNMTSSEKITVGISLIGFVDKKYLVLRSGAKNDDLIFCTGNLGKSAAGLECLKRCIKSPAIKNNLEPSSRLELGKKLAKIGINSMIDVSDGLAPEIRHICDSSNVGALIYADKIPISGSTIKAGKKLKKDPINFALYGGEDYELVFTSGKDKFKKLKKMGMTLIGKVVDKKEGIRLLKNNKKLSLKHGFDHFKKK